MCDLPGFVRAEELTVYVYELRRCVHDESIVGVRDVMHTFICAREMASCTCTSIIYIIYVVRSVGTVHSYDSYTRANWKEAFPRQIIL